MRRIESRAPRASDAWQAVRDSSRSTGDEGASFARQAHDECDVITASERARWIVAPPRQSRRSKTRVACSRGAWQGRRGHRVACARGVGESNRSSGLDPTSSDRRRGACGKGRTWTYEEERGETVAVTRRCLVSRVRGMRETQRARSKTSECASTSSASAAGVSVSPQTRSRRRHELLEGRSAILVR